VKTLCALVVALALVGSARPAPSSDGFQLIVNSANPVASLSREKASKMFLKKISKWDSGAAVAPVDLDQGSPVRAAFSRAVHGKPVSAVVSYWQQLIFSGRDVPPPEKGSDAAVIAFVKANPGAIGYVGGSVPSDVKVLVLQ
jgi:ABC-type phosphate transport system substrate-binding protein